MKSFLTGGSLLASMLVLSACGSSTVSVGATSDAAEDGALGGGGGGVEPSDGATSDGAVATSDAGSDTQPVGTDAAPETSTTVPDGGGPSTTYPAFPVDIGTIANNGGPVLTAEQVVTITWTNDPDEAAYEAFGDTIGASNYWSTINSQYGVGPAVSGSTNHVRLTDTLPTSGLHRGAARIVADDEPREHFDRLARAERADGLHLLLAPERGLHGDGRDDVRLQQWNGRLPRPIPRWFDRHRVRDGPALPRLRGG